MEIWFLNMDININNLLLVISNESNTFNLSLNYCNEMKFIISSDDIEELKWFSLVMFNQTYATVTTTIVEEHVPLMKSLLTHAPVI